MKVSVKITPVATATTAGTTTAVATATTAPVVPAPTIPETVLIMGTAYKIGDNNFHIDVEAGDHTKGVYEFIDIGSGVWFNPELNKKLVGFCVSTCGKSEWIVINDHFDWEEFFSLPIIPSGGFDGTTWDGTMVNRVGEQAHFRCKFVYREDESYVYMKKSFEKGEVCIINSVDELLASFSKFEDFLNNEGGRAKNPFL